MLGVNEEPTPEEENILFSSYSILFDIKLSDGYGVIGHSPTVREVKGHSPTHSMVPLTVFRPGGQLTWHRPLFEYKPSLHFVQKLRLKHASQCSILHSERKGDQKKQRNK